MSFTQVYTGTADGRNASKGSIVIHARSPNATQDACNSRRSYDKCNEIELAQLGGEGHPGSAQRNVAGQPASITETQAKLSTWPSRIQFATLTFTLFFAGWTDGTTGPLLPRMQANYNVGYTIVSFIFMFGCLGFVTAAGANVYLTDKLGFGKVMVMGSLAQLVACAIQSAAPPFPAFVLAFFLSGFGGALQDAGANAYVASLKDNAQTKMGILHAMYGAGAFCAPLSATPFSKRNHWNFHYLASLGIAVLNTVLLTAVFKFKTQDQCLNEVGQARTHADEANHEDNKYRQIFRLREVHYLAFFILIYVGVEVTLGGWTVTYVTQVRGGGSSSGYVSSGFFGGLALGRVLLLWANHKIGERRALYVYTILAICLELVVWLVPSLVGGAVSVSLIGMFLGPVYPIVMNHTARILPHWLLTGSIGWIAGFGQAGSAFLPFLTGVIASKAGIWALQPLMVATMALMLVLWFLVPAKPRRID